MRISKTAWLGIISLCVAIVAYALFSGSGQSDFRSKSGFRGLKWGAPISEYEGAASSDFKLINSSEYLCVYINANEKKYLGDVPLDDVYYVSLIVDGVEKFECVTISISKEARDNYESQIVDILTKEYGKYAKKGIAGRECYIFEDKYVKVRYYPKAGWYGMGEMRIYSKEMRSRYSEIWEKGVAKKEIRETHFNMDY